MSTEAVAYRLPGHPASERFDFEVTDARVACLGRLLGGPATHTQRFVEKLTFLSSGGQRWERELQIRIPPEADPRAGNLWIVSLGEYTRGRLADFEVTDATGHGLNLVTRQQHGDALTDVVTRQFVQMADSSGGNKELPNAVNSFRKGLFDFFTSSRTRDVQPPTKKEKAKELASDFRDLLEGVALTDKDKDKAVEDFANALGPWVKATQYLCWVDARPGEVIRLHSSYSLADPNQYGAASFSDEVRSVLAAFKGSAHTEPQGRARLANLYRGLGLAPIDYSFNAPKGSSAPGSYYFIVQPPPATEVTYLDWESGWQMLDEQEGSDVKCAFPAAHIHSTTSPPSDPAATAKTYINMRAYLRCAPYRHKQILGAVALNLALVFLLAHGRLPAQFSEPLQGLIIAAPSVVIGYLAQQQRHYYSDVMRRQRFLLWFYLAISIAFLVSVAFSERDGTPTLQTVATGTAWLLAIASGGVLGWQVLLGSSYARSIARIASKRAARQPSAPMWEHYGVAVRKRGSWVLFFIGAGMVAAAICMVVFWESEDSADRPPAPPAHQNERRKSGSKEGHNHDRHRHQGVPRFHSTLHGVNTTHSGA